MINILENALGPITSFYNYSSSRMLNTGPCSDKRSAPEMRKICFEPVFLLLWFIFIASTVFGQLSMVVMFFLHFCLNGYARWCQQICTITLGSVISFSLEGLIDQRRITFSVTARAPMLNVSERKQSQLQSICGLYSMVNLERTEIKLTTVY